MLAKLRVHAGMECQCAGLQAPEAWRAFGFAAASTATSHRCGPTNAHLSEREGYRQRPFAFKNGVGIHVCCGGLPLIVYRFIQLL
jgi:hypothetical protein